MNQDDKFKVISEMKRFIEYVDEIVINYPRKSYVLRNRLEDTSYRCLELMYYTNMIDNRLNGQKQIMSLICMLDYYLNVSVKKEYISYKRMQQGARILDDVRKLMYGWVKSNGSKV